MNKFITLSFILLVLNNLLAQTPVLVEDFQSGIPNNWTLLNEDGNTPASQVQEYNAAWISKTDPDSSSNTAASSTSFFSPSGTANRWLITPPIVLGGYGNAISWKAKSHDASFPDDYVVLYSKTGNLKSDFLDTIGFIQGESEDWIERRVNLSTKNLDNETVYFAFVLNTNDGFKLYLDDVTVTKDDAAKITVQNKEIKFGNLGEGRYVISKNLKVTDLEVFDIQGKAIPFSLIDDVLSIPSKGMFFLKGLSNSQPFSVKVHH
ncbi:MAG: choice-of-anchor J domain-containing protein [Bacteroidetes bacterium]|nr:choice-of-anchor J domain-containing protein [Bacteroidota bacterium]